jgi:Protein ENHANCED DISEASE RESISTANCE 2, C-terminal
VAGTSCSGAVVVTAAVTSPMASVVEASTGATAGSRSSSVVAARNAHRQKSKAKDAVAATAAATTTTVSVLPLFPDGAALGSHFNCWSPPAAHDFLVRGPHYLVDHVKVPSSQSAGYLFPCRGMDLFLTDATTSAPPPSHVVAAAAAAQVGTAAASAAAAALLGGRLRDVPTLIVNFRLPWGMLILYSAIPTHLVPFLPTSATTTSTCTKATVSSRQADLISTLSPAERVVASWLRGDDAFKNQRLKIIPTVVHGPWVVKSVVSGKPAIIGSKVPTTYYYSDDNDDPTLAPYIEVDLDISASATARSILSVARSYTNAMTLNLGFVIQANHVDELPEQMLTGVRLHGLDPATAPTWPSSSSGSSDKRNTSPLISDDESE